LQKQIDPEILEERARAALEKEHEQFTKAQRRFGDLVGGIMELEPGNELIADSNVDRNQFDVTLYNIFDPNTSCGQYSEKLSCNDI
jgi:hypothetical protein